MKIKFVFCVLFCLVPALSAPAQENREDSQAEAAVRARLDRVRRDRPSVALVLSGGGAKGAAHVGVLKILDSLQIPVDLVVGTSIGGLVGGLYSLGYPVSTLDSLFRNIDWQETFADRVPRNYISYSESKYKEKYALSFPFYYSWDSEYMNRFSRDASSLVRDNLLGSLPSGILSGQNVSNIIASMTVGYQDELSFAELPIPFVCVATDIVNGKEKDWFRGKLNTAMRSTMSIPGLFAPVRDGQSVLLDGGWRNNYPTDVARKLGADIIIGVDITADFVGYEDINNLVDILSSSMDMLGRTAYEQNVGLAQINIRPDISGYDMLSFNPAAIDTLMLRGSSAARGHLDELEMLGKLGRYGTESRAVNLSGKKVLVEAVEITGVTEAESRYMMRRLPFSAGQRIGKAEVENAVAAIYGRGSFRSVAFELLGSEEPYRLKINCVKGPIHRLGLGARFDSEELVSAAVNVGFNAYALSGHSLDLYGKIGSNPSAGLHWRYMGENLPIVNLNASYRYVDRNLFKMGDSRFRLGYHNFRADLFLSNMSLNYFDLRLGVRENYFKISSVFSDRFLNDYDLTLTHNHYFGPFVELRADSFDNGYYPTSGWTAGLEASLTASGEFRRPDAFFSLGGDAKLVIPFGERFCVLPSVAARVLISDADIPLPFINVVGGRMRGRYLEQQLPFVGIDNVAAASPSIGIIRADFRYRVFPSNYISAIVNASAEASHPENVISGAGRRCFWGAGLEYAYNSIVGPFAVYVHWSDRTGHVGGGISLGFDF